MVGSEWVGGSQRCKNWKKYWIFTPLELGIVELFDFSFVFLVFYFLSFVRFVLELDRRKGGLLGEVEVEVEVVVGRDNHNLGCIVLQVLFS